MGVKSRNNPQQPLHCGIHRLVFAGIGLVFLLTLPNSLQARKWLWFGESEPSFAPLPRVSVYDAKLDTERGIRLVLHPEVENPDNLQIDRRITLALQTQLRKFSDQAIMVMDVAEQTLRDRLDNLMRQSLRDWKSKGKLDPAAINPILQDVDFDAVVLFQRTKYEPVWRNDEKYFRIELVGAAFSVDTGLPLWQDSIVLEEEWTGSSSSTNRLENKAAYGLAAKLNTALLSISEQIRQRRMALLAAEKGAQEKAAQERAMQLTEEDRRLKQLVAEADLVLATQTEPATTIVEIRQGRDWLGENLTVPGPQQSDELVKTRREVGDFLREKLSEWDQWYQAEQARLAALPKDTPIGAPPSGSEEPLDGGPRIDFSVLSTPAPEPPLEDVPRPFALSPDDIAGPVKPSPTPTRRLVRSEDIFPPTPTITPTPSPQIPEAPPTLPPAFYYPEPGVFGPETEPATQAATAGLAEAQTGMVDISPASRAERLDAGRKRAWSIFGEIDPNAGYSGAEIKAGTGPAPSILKAQPKNPLQEVLDRRRAARNIQPSFGQMIRPLPLLTPSPSPAGTPAAGELPEPVPAQIPQQP